MSSHDANDGKPKVSGTYRTNRAAFATTAHLVRGTVAASQCRELLDRGDIPAAHTHFLLLAQALIDLTDDGHDKATAARVLALRVEESNLGRRIAIAMKRAGVRKLG